MATTPNSIITPQSLKAQSVVVTAAKTTLNDSANASGLVSASGNGAVVYRITAMPRATVTATQLQLYRSPDAGTTLYLINSVLMSAYTLANTTAVPVTDFGYSESNPLRLLASEVLYVGAAVALAGGIVFTAQYEDL